MRKLVAGVAIGGVLVAGSVSLAATDGIGDGPGLARAGENPMILLAQTDEADATEGTGAMDGTGTADETGAAEDAGGAEDSAADPAAADADDQAPADPAATGSDEETAPTEAPGTTGDAGADPAAATDPAAPEGEAPLDMAALSGSWVADEINGTASAEGVVSWLRLTEAGRAQGQGGCNSYSGSYTLEEGSASFGPFVSTRRSCPETQLSQEERFFAALGAVAGVRVEDGKLMLLDEQGSPLVTLNRM